MMTICYGYTLEWMGHSISLRKLLLQMVSVKISKEWVTIRSGCCWMIYPVCNKSQLTTRSLDRVFTTLEITLPLAYFTSRLRFAPITAGICRDLVVAKNIQALASEFSGRMLFESVRQNCYRSNIRIYYEHLIQIYFLFYSKISTIQYLILRSYDF